MVYKEHRQGGFTVIELFVLIVVICILAYFVATTFSSVRQQDRNSARRTNVKAIARALELYNAQKLYYPASAELTAPDGSVAIWVATNLKTLDINYLRDPLGNNLYLNAGDATRTMYGYVPSPAGCDNSLLNECKSFVLTYLPESGMLIKTNSLSAN